MPLSNTPDSFGSVTRLFHWLTALLILTAIPLGVIANWLPYDTSEALAQKAWLFSLHKTLGVAAFAVALLRILWAFGQSRPEPLNPGRRGEVLLAGVVHWVLYVSMLAVPLSGWVHHAATEGFAPILWPLGQGLPLVPVSETVAGAAAALHWVFTKLLAASILLHVAGALKHHLIDRDATLRRMVRGQSAGSQASGSEGRHGGWRAPVLAGAIYVAGAAVAIALVDPVPTQGRAAAVPSEGAASLVAQGNWQVEQGTLGLGVQQLGSQVRGSFAGWTADITFDDALTEGVVGAVTVQIDTGSLTLGSVSQQAMGPEFLDAAGGGRAVFAATIRRVGQGYEAQGSLTLRGASVPVVLPFDLTLDQDRATMRGQTRLDRRDFGMGASYPDEATVGFGVEVSVELTARRK